MRPIDADAIYPWYIKSFSEEVCGDKKITPNEVRFSMNDIRENLDNIPTVYTWIPTSEQVPNEAGYYLTTTIYNEVYCDYWNEGNFDRTETVIAWMPLPEPYRTEMRLRNSDNGKIRPRDSKTGIHT